MGITIMGIAMPIIGIAAVGGVGVAALSLPQKHCVSMPGVSPGHHEFFRHFSCTNPGEWDHCGVASSNHHAGILD